MKIPLFLTLILTYTPAVIRAADSFAGPAADAPRPWMDRSLPPADRAERLVQAMTLDEKISQIHMLDIPSHPREVAGVPRLGIPIFKITNGPAGAGPGDSRGGQPATALPAALAVAASWDVSAAERFGHVAGKEVAARPEHLIEGPGLNITRVPQNGRNFEYFGEDPYLTARMGVAEVRAIQSEGIIAEAKHFAANSQETARKTINEIIDERTLREIYLPAFEAVVKEADVGAIMAAYPSVNGAFCSENPHLLNDILRGEWGFKGFVQSDYTGTNSAIRAAKAGLDLSMKADFYGEKMKDSLKSGEVSEATINTMLLRRYTKMFQFGMFDAVRAAATIPAEQHGAIARAIADESVVLLKNTGGQLPLDAKQIHSIALIGPYAGAALTGGRGSSMVRPLYTVAPLDGLKHRAGTAVAVVYDEGRDLTAAANAAKAADVVLVMVGNRDREGGDRSDLSLEGNQDALIAAVADANRRTIVILKTGGPVLMPWLEKVPVVVQAWYPGQEDGNVVADVVFGDVNPSGKLPMTFPKVASEVPASTPEQYPGVMYSDVDPSGKQARAGKDGAVDPQAEALERHGGFSGNATYSEKLLVGYRWYDAKNVEPLFPFGFGLSYTTFSFGKLSLGKYAADHPLEVSVDVTNTGEREGAEVVQVYVAAPATAGEPPKQLKGFAKVSLKPKETQRVRMTVDPRAFSVWSTDAKAWTVVKGRHEILVGDSSRNLPLHAAVTVP
jgi:beta-glucosidase